MIRVHRPKGEPPAVAAQRDKGIANALKAHSRGNASPLEALKTQLKNYDGGKERLYRTQHRKCAYCERNAGLRESPLEHFRPKAQASRHLRGEKPPQVDLDRYWWLAWTWENMLFSCVTCNGNKGTYFPLAAGTEPLPVPTWTAGATTLPARAFDTRAESPLLVDPAATDPLDHITWRPNNPGEPRTLWRWDPVHLTDIGRVTISTLRLDELTDHVSHHIRTNLLARTAQIERDIDSGNLVNAASAWKQLCVDVASPDCVFAAASWCALERLVCPTLQQRGQLQACPRP